MKVKNTWNDYKIKLKEAFTDLKTKGRRHRQIPNLLTASRLIAAPFFIIPAAINKSIFWIIVFITIFSLTDALDGYIARRYKLVSDLGKDLDAACDKVFALSLLISASIFKPVLIWNILAEVVIAIINVKEKINDKKPKSLYVGKIKAWVLYPLLGLAFVDSLTNVTEIFNVFMGATICMQMLTITFYLIKYESHTDEKEMVEMIEAEEKKVKKEALKKISKKNKNA